MPLTDRDYDLLSLYIDDALTPPERHAVDSRLASDSEFHAELEALRQTIALISSMPEMIAPRDLRLSPQTVADALAEFKTPKATPRKPVSFMRIAVNFAAAAASFVLVLAGTFTLIQPPTAPTIMNVAMQSDLNDLPRTENSDQILEIAGTPTEKTTFDLMLIDATVAPETALLESMDAINDAESTGGSSDMTARSAANQSYAISPTVSAESDTFSAIPAPMAANEIALGEASATLEATLPANSGSAGMFELLPPDQQITPVAELAARGMEETADTGAPENGILPSAPVLQDSLSHTGLPTSSPLLGLALIISGLALGVSTLIVRNRG